MWWDVGELARGLAWWATVLWRTSCGKWCSFRGFSTCKPYITIPTSSRFPSLFLIRLEFIDLAEPQVSLHNGRCYSIAVVNVREKVDRASEKGSVRNETI